MTDTRTVRIVLPYHLRTLARVEGEATVGLTGPVTIRTVLNALEAEHPKLRGTIREHGTQKRRDFVRYFACSQDLSHTSPDAELPESIAAGEEPFLVVGAIAGG